MKHGLVGCYPHYLCFSLEYFIFYFKVLIADFNDQLYWVPLGRKKAVVITDHIEKQLCSVLFWLTPLRLPQVSCLACIMIFSQKHPSGYIDSKALSLYNFGAF